MSTNVCPKCGNTSLIRKPHSRIMTDNLGSVHHTANEYSLDCLYIGCNYTSGRITKKPQHKS